jgi:beta-lactamase superfamily II metal-dependent hydrolase
VRVQWIATAILAGTMAAGATWAVASRPDGLLHVTVLATGSSTSVLVRTAGGATALVDGGSSPTLLLAALGRVMPPASSYLDMVVLTGGEEGAVNGLSGLEGHYSVGSVVSPGELGPGASTIVAGLEATGANVLSPGGAPWSFGGATWRCLSFVALTTGAEMCVLTVGDRSGRAVVLGDAGTADQEDLCAVYGPELRADLVVTPPGGAVSPVLLVTARPVELAVPAAPGAATAPAAPGYATDRTSTDGDLTYSGSSSGLVAGT